MIPGEALHLGHLGSDEISFLSGLSSTMSLDEFGVDAFWLRVAPRHRTWLVETPDGRVTYRVDTTHPDDQNPDPAVQRWLPIPERILRVAVANSGDTETADLVLVDGSTAVLTCTDTSGAVDLVTGVEPPSSMTWIASSDVAVPTNRLAGMLWSAYAIPNTVLEQRTRPYPPMWLRLDEDGAALHVDWNAADSGRSTFRCSGDFDGEPITVPIRPNLLQAFVHQLVFHVHDERPDSICQVSVSQVEYGDDERTRRQVVDIRRGRAVLTVWVTDPLVDRWGRAITRGIREADVELLGNEDSEWLVRGFGVDVLIALHHGHPDHARVSAVLCKGATDELDLLREVNQLNTVSSGPRFVVTDGTVRAITDIPCTEVDQIATTLTRVIDDTITEARRYAPLLGSLIGA